MSWAVEKQRQRSRSSWLGSGGVYEAFDDAQGLRQSVVNEIREHGRLTTSDVALYDDGKSCAANRATRHDYTYDERVERRAAVKATKAAAQQRRWELERRDRQARKEMQAEQEWREWQAAKTLVEQTELAAKAERLKRERERAKYAHYAKLEVEQARVENLRAQLEAERAEAETAQWVEDRQQQLRERELARQVLGHDAPREDIDELVRRGYELLRLAKEKYLRGKR